MTFPSERTVKAVRKEHRCDACGMTITIGSPATRWSGLTDGDFGSTVYHPDCREAEIEFNRRAGGNADEWYRLDNESRRELSWLWPNYPAVAARFRVLNPD